MAEPLSKGAHQLRRTIRRSIGRIAGVLRDADPTLSAAEAIALAWKRHPELVRADQRAAKAEKAELRRAKVTKENEPGRQRMDSTDYEIRKAMALKDGARARRAIEQVISKSAAASISAAISAGDDLSMAQARAAAWSKPLKDSYRAAVAMETKYPASSSADPVAKAKQKPLTIREAAAVAVDKIAVGPVAMLSAENLQKSPVQLRNLVRASAAYSEVKALVAAHGDKPVNTVTKAGEHAEAFKKLARWSEGTW